MRLIGDGTRVLEVTPASGVRVRDVAPDSVLRAFESDPAIQYPFILSPDHSLLLTGGTDNRAHIWNVASGQHLQTLTGHSGRVLFASFSARGDTVATSATDGVVRLWDARTGECTSVVLKSSTPGAHSVSLSPDSRFVLTWRQHHYVTSRNTSALAEKHLVAIATLTEAPLQAGRWILGCAWRDDSKRLYTARHIETQGGGRSWPTAEIIQARAPDGQPPGTWPQLSEAWLRPAVYRPGLHPPVAMTSSMARRMDVPRAGEMWPLDLLHRVYRLAMSGDGSTFAAVTSRGAIDIWRRAAEE